MDTDNVIRIGAGLTAWALCVDDAGELRQMAFGPASHEIALEFPTVLYPRAIPAFGTEPHRRTALRVTHHDGTRSTRLRVRDVQRSQLKDCDGETVVIHLSDADFALDVRLIFDVASEFDVVSQRLEITNREAAPITVWEYATSSPIMAASDPTWTHIGGGWAHEWTPTFERLRSGVKLVESTGGIRPHLQQMPAMLIGPDGAWTETDGTVVSAQIAWTGNIAFEAEIWPNGALRIPAGSNPRAAELVVDPGERITLPEVTWAWSTSGLGPLSRRLHEFTRTHRVRDGHRARSIVANNWETTFFDFDEQRLIGLVNDAADLGAELFLLDDGWFGDRYARDDDTRGLGDWVTDHTKLPNELQPVIDAALERKIRFGLWVEPEMVNPNSELFEQHPEWIIGDTARAEQTLERHQLALDLLRPEVRDFVVATVGRILEDHPHISYLKWDANRALIETGSPTLADHRQGRVLHDLVDATWDVMRRIADAHPDVELMLCASGGGRSDLGALRHFHELWTSDNTDPLDRLRMQWAASWFLPANVLGAHVTRWGDHSVAFAAAVAMTARFGWDIDTAGLNDEERSSLAAAAELYKELRPLIQHGELYRIESPFDGPRSLLGYASPSRDRAVVFGFQLTEAIAGQDAASPVVLPDGFLDSSQSYTTTLTVVDREFRTTEPTEPTESSESLVWPLTTRETAAIWRFDPA